MQCASCDGSLAVIDQKKCDSCKKLVHKLCLVAKDIKLGQWTTIMQTCQKCVARFVGMDTEKSDSEQIELISKKNKKGEPEVDIGGALTLIFKKLGRLTEIKNAVEFIALHNDDLLAQSVKNTTTIENLNNTVGALKSQITAKDKLIDDLVNRVNSLEQDQLSNNIEILGVDMNDGEDLRKAVTQLGEKLGMQQCADTIDIVRRRYKHSPGHPPTISLTTKTPGQKAVWMDLRKKLREERTTSGSIFGTASTEKIFINESLTYYTRTLLKKVKDHGRDKGYKYIWTRNGQIFARKGDTFGSIKICCESEMLKTMP